METLCIIFVVGVLAIGLLITILLGGVVDKFKEVVQSLDSISANLHIMRNDARDVAEMFESGVRVEIEELDELD